MDVEFQNAVNGHTNFNGVSLGMFSALEDVDINVFFDDADGETPLLRVIFKGRLLELRTKYRMCQGSYFSKYPSMNC
jgi:hypothetical protein